MKDKKNRFGFLSDSEVEQARQQAEMMKSGLNPFQREIIQVADQAMAEVNAAFDFHPVVLELANKAGLTPNEVERRITGTKRGDYIVEDFSSKRAYFKTVDGKLQEASAYLNRVEKTTIELMRRLTEQDNQTAMQLFRRAFKKLFARKKQGSSIFFNSPRPS